MNIKDLIKVGDKVKFIGMPYLVERNITDLVLEVTSVYSNHFNVVNNDYSWGITYTGSDGCGDYWTWTDVEINGKLASEIIEDRSGYVDEDGNRHYRCDFCGEIFDDIDDVEFDDNGTCCCSDCLDDDVHRCDDCGEFESSDDMYYIEDDGKYVCQDCFDVGGYCKCIECCNYYTRDSLRYVHGGGYVCEDCYDSNDYYTCENCGDAISHGDLYWCHDDPYCEDCRSDEEEACEGAIWDYHEHDRYNLPCYNEYNKSVSASEFKGGFGFELEVDNGNDRGECSLNLERLLGDHAIYEYDGSLDEGFEIISRPMTLEAFNDFPVKEMMKIIRDYDFTSHNAGTCGLHIHTSRSLYGDTEEERTENIAKCVLFFEKFWDDIAKVSRRKYFGYCHKLGGDYNGEIDEERAKNIAKGTDSLSYDSHGQAINLGNKDTIEYRVMRGTLKLSTFYATVDFIMTMVANSKKIPMDKVGDKDLWLDGMKPETIEYIKERRAFGYEPDDETEDD